MSAEALAKVQRVRFADADDGTEHALEASLTVRGSGADHAVVTTSVLRTWPSSSQEQESHLALGGSSG